MAGLGSACLFAGLLTAVYAAAASLYAARTGNREFAVSGRRAIYCLAALMVGAATPFSPAAASPSFVVAKAELSLLKPFSFSKSLSPP